MQPSAIPRALPRLRTQICDLAVERGYIADPLVHLEELAFRKVNNATDGLTNMTNLPNEQLLEAYESLMHIRQQRLQTI